MSGSSGSATLATWLDRSNVSWVADRTASARVPIWIAWIRTASATIPVSRVAQRPMYHQRMVRRSGGSR